MGFGPLQDQFYLSGSASWKLGATGSVLSQWIPFLETWCNRIPNPRGFSELDLN